MSETYETIAYATADEFIESLRPEAAPFGDYGAREWAFRGQPEDKELIASAFRLEQRHLFCASDEVWLKWANSQQIAAEIEVTVDFFEGADAVGLLLPDDSPQLRARLSQFRRAALEHPPSELLREWPPRDLSSLARISHRRYKKPPHRAIKLSVSNNLMAREAAAWNRQSVALNN